MAIAAKEAQEAAAAEANAAKDAAAPPKPRSKFAELRGEVYFNKDGVKRSGASNAKRTRTTVLGRIIVGATMRM